MLTVLGDGSSLGDEDTISALESRNSTQGELGEEGGLLGLGHLNVDLLDGFAGQGSNSLHTLDAPVVCGKRQRENGLPKKAKGRNILG